MERLKDTVEWLTWRRWFEAELAKQDGLTLRVVSKGNGYEWLVADYILPAKSVREVWGLTPHQMRRFTAWLLAFNTELIQWE